jgi:hypothetical protein
MVLTALLAHQGGWDEILMVVGPVLVVVALLLVVRRRIERRNAAVETAAPAVADAEASQPDDVSTD